MEVLRPLLLHPCKETRAGQVLKGAGRKVTREQVLRQNLGQGVVCDVQKAGVAKIGREGTGWGVSGKFFCLYFSHAALSHPRLSRGLWRSCCLLTSTDVLPLCVLQNILHIAARVVVFSKRQSEHGSLCLKPFNGFPVNLQALQHLLHASLSPLFCLTTLAFWEQAKAFPVFGSCVCSSSCLEGSSSQLLPEFRISVQLDSPLLLPFSSMSLCCIFLLTPGTCEIMFHLFTACLFFMI